MHLLPILLSRVREYDALCHVPKTVQFRESHDIANSIPQGLIKSWGISGIVRRLQQPQSANYNKISKSCHEREDQA